MKAKNVDKEKLSEFLCNRLEEEEYIPCINNGGCGIVALEINRRLAEYGIRSTIINIGDRAHIVIKIGERFIDYKGEFGNGVNDLKSNARNKYYTDYIKIMRYKDLKWYCDQEDCWNNMFDRHAYYEDVIKNIRHAVDNAVKDLQNWSIKPSLN